VREYLIKKGIAPERMTTKGYGDTNPIADNASEAGRQKNRRTEIRILKE
jgi:OmpA-OmpF porin, OOP family